MDRDLVVKAQTGDVAAFTAVADRRLPRLFKTARLILRSDDLASDVVQDALLRAWLDLPGLRDPDRFDAWLHRLLVRACYLAAERRRKRFVVEIELDPIDGPAVADVQSSTAIRDQLERGFLRLNTDQRIVVVLHHYLGMSLAETADVVGVPVGTVQSRLNRALRGLRTAIEADELLPVSREAAP